MDFVQKCIPYPTLLTNEKTTDPVHHVCGYVNRHLGACPNQHP